MIVITPEFARVLRDVMSKFDDNELAGFLTSLIISACASELVSQMSPKCYEAWRESIDNEVRPPKAPS